MTGPPLTLSKTRLAPTPSGFLHLGNIYSFAFTAALAHKNQTTVFLRIDDLDQLRVREDYLEDIFESLRYLEIPWQEGPANPAEFKSEYSQLLRQNNYAGALETLRKKNLLYACACSRKKSAGEKKEKCECRLNNFSFELPDVSWKIKTEPEDQVIIKTVEGFKEMRFPDSMKDPIVRKKDGNASYQLSSLVDDVFFGIDLVVRGEDLIDSSLVQLYIARSLGYETFFGATFVHHALLTKENGQKLSKSAGDTSVRFLKEKGLKPRDIYQMIGDMAGVEGLQHWRDLCGIV